MAKAQLFIGSSTKGLPVARRVAVELGRTFRATLWTDGGVFRLGDFILESLERQLDESRYGVLVATDDDILIKDGKRYSTLRDNVLFEFGLFVGRLGRKRSFLLVPARPVIKLPSDLEGLLVGRIDLSKDGIQQSALAACGEISKRILSSGSEARAQSSSSARVRRMVGSWSGRIRQEVPGSRSSSSIEYSLRVNVRARNGRLVGYAELDDPRGATSTSSSASRVDAQVRVEGAMMSDTIMVIQYRHPSDAVIQMGTIYCTVNANANELKGTLCGFGNYSEGVITGSIGLTKA